MRGRDFFVVGVVMSLRAVAGAGASRPRSVTGEYGGMVWSIPQSALPGLCESDGLLFRGCASSAFCEPRLITNTRVLQHPQNVGIFQCYATPSPRGGCSEAALLDQGGYAVEGGVIFVFFGLVFAVDIDTEQFAEAVVECGSC